jgi:large subunit ribosomal protein L18
MLKQERSKRKRRVRSKIFGTGKRPRLSVFRSAKYIYAQLINDEKGNTLLEAHGQEAGRVGEDLAKKALKKKIKEVVFDRSGYQFHGRVKALAEGAKKGGLKF